MVYALLIYRTEGHSALPEEEEQRALQAHRALQADAASQLRAVAQLREAPAARTVRFREGGLAVCDGPYIETKEWLVGFYLLECASEEEALERAKSICPVDSHAVEVRPAAWVWEG